MHLDHRYCDLCMLILIYQGKFGVGPGLLEGFEELIVRFGLRDGMVRANRNP